MAFETYNAREEIAGFWDPERGPVTGFFTKLVENGENPFYLVRVTESCPTAGSEKRNIPAGVVNAGALVAVDKKAGLVEIEKNLGHLFKVARKEKVTLKNGRSFWKFDIQIDRQAKLPGMETEKTQESEIPF